MEMATLDGCISHTCWNYSGERLAAAGVDGTIQIWDTRATGSVDLTLTTQWKVEGDGIISRLAWGPPEFGELIASCSTSGSICLWEEAAEGGEESTWRLCARVEDIHIPVLNIQFGNPPNGLKLVAVYADGYARIYETSDLLNLKHWQLQAEFQNMKNLSERTDKCIFSAASISWRGPISATQVPAFVLGFNSNSVLFNIAKIWEFEESRQRWYCIAELKEENDENEPINDLAWAPNIGRAYEMIAVAAGDGVSIWHVKYLPSMHERLSVKRVARLTGFDEKVLQVEWDMSGMTLASLGSDGIVRLWQSNLKGEWHQQAQIEGS